MDLRQLRHGPAKAVLRLIFNLVFAFYHGILGLLSGSPLLMASGIYYLLLWSMRFSTLLLDRRRRRRDEALTCTNVGILLMVLSFVFHIMVIISIRDQTAAAYGTIPMLTIATYTFAKIAAAVMTAIRHRGRPSGFAEAGNAIRYSEVAVSLLNMQQSMLVSFGDGSGSSAVILNALTGAGVCFFILALGIHTFQYRKKEHTYGKE